LYACAARDEAVTAVRRARFRERIGIGSSGEGFTRWTIQLVRWSFRIDTLGMAEFRST
jgi:hypothetical protein